MAQLAVVCWSGMCGLGSLETGCSSPMNTPQFNHISGSPESQSGPFSETNKPPLERDRDIIVECYAGASSVALDSLTPELHHNLYKSIRIEVFAHADGTTEIVLGDLLSYEEVRTKESLSRSQVCTTLPTACRSCAA
jgi:rhodanese-related sulfurtransferase